MASPSAAATLLDLIDAPAALCGATGTLVSYNAAFSAWGGGVEGARVEVHAGRGLLLTKSQPPRAMRMTPLSGGGWLALAILEEDPGALAAVAKAVARRLARLEASLEGNAAMALLERPPEPVADCLRETLAATQELKILRGQIESLAGETPPTGTPACLRTLLRDAVGALGTGLPVTLTSSEGDATVEVDRARLFHLMVAVLGALGRYGPVHAAVTGGDSVLVRLSVSSRDIDAMSGPEVEALRRFLPIHDGRLLVADASSLVMELPAFARTSAGADAGSAGADVGMVLVVDDDESTLAMMSAVLRRAGFHVLTAENGVEASVLLRQHAEEIVAVVADAVLPGRSGLELAAEARGHVPGIPVLLVSGHPSDLLGTQKDRGDVPLLSKPFGARVLAERVRALVALTHRQGDPEDEDTE